MRNAGLEKTQAGIKIAGRNINNLRYADDTTLINTKIRLIIFFAAKDREALYSQQKEDWELTVAQIMNSLLPNSDSN